MSAKTANRVYPVVWTNKTSKEKRKAGRRHWTWKFTSLLTNRSMCVQYITTDDICKSHQGPVVFTNFFVVQITFVYQA